MSRSILSIGCSFASKTLGLGRKNPKASTRRLMVLNAKQTASACSICSREAPAANCGRYRELRVALSLLLSRRVEGSESRVVLPSGTADCSRYHHLKDLILALA